jgi:hypothetical protein
MITTRRLVGTIAVAAATVTLMVPGSAMAASTSSTHVAGAVAVSARNDRVDTQFRFAVNESRAAIVNAINGSYATTTGCYGCGAGAVSFQIVHAQSPKTAVVNARNDAKAYSYKCVECSNLAAAYQFIVVDPSGKPLTSDERQALRDLEAELKALRGSGTPPADLADDIEQLAGEVVEVLQGTTSNQRSSISRSVTVNRQVQAGA